VLSRIQSNSRGIALIELLPRFRAMIAAKNLRSIPHSIFSL
jgi:hypothetical protein